MYDLTAEQATALDITWRRVTHAANCAPPSRKSQLIDAANIAHGISLTTPPSGEANLFTRWITEAIHALAAAIATDERHL